MNNKIIYQVDSFTTTIFKGNPAGVVLLENAISEEKMQSVAAEMNLSETAFVTAENDYYNIRFFTPTNEIDLCGHATLASAHILYETGIVSKEKSIEFKANKDKLKVTFSEDWITMEFPVFKIEKTNTPVQLSKAIGNAKILECYQGNGDWYLAYIDSKNNLADLEINFELLKAEVPSLLVITTEDADGEFDFLYRCFAPNQGIDEDPVTGSAQCLLTSFWKEKLNQTTFISQQVSERTGILKTKYENGKVKISGQAITVFKAELANSL